MNNQTTAMTVGWARQQPPLGPLTASCRLRRTIYLTSTNYIGEPNLMRHNQNDTPVKSLDFLVLSILPAFQRMIFTYQSQWVSLFETSNGSSLATLESGDNPELAIVLCMKKDGFPFVPSPVPTVWNYCQWGIKGSRPLPRRPQLMAGTYQGQIR